jgi:C-terminal processing protease CtpA/Prc
MRFERVGTAMAMLALVSGCGGGGGSTPAPPPVAGPPATPTPPAPPPTSAGCSLQERQNWAAGVLNEWYLFPETLPASLIPTQVNVEDYVHYLTANARAQGRDRFFTYRTSLAADNAFNNSGSTAGFGARFLLDSGQRRLFISESYENAPALDAGLDRGVEILAIGTTASNLQTVESIFNAEGSAGITSALGPNDPGVSRVFRVVDASGTRDVTLVKRSFELLPVSPRYGARILEDNGQRIGYVNLRTFIGTADQALRNAFAQFKQQGVTQVIVDFRYNGGGLLATAAVLSNLLGGGRSSSDVQSRLEYRASKAGNSFTRFFAPLPESIAPIRIAFIGRSGTASASELVINTFVPYFGNNMALIGTNTFGKPVGQTFIDRAQCDDRIRVTAFRMVNSAGHSDYFSGLAPSVPVTCQAGDDLARQFGDPQEASVRQALDYLAGRSCTPITSTGASTQSVNGGRGLLTPAQPTTVQREAPGSF